MNINHKTGEILECFGFMAGLHPKEAEKVQLKLIEIIKEANKDLRHKIAEEIVGCNKVGETILGNKLILAQEAHRIAMNTHLDLEN